MDNSLLPNIINGLAVVASGTAVTAFLTGRANAKKTRTESRGLEAKLPAEVDSIAVQGAEAAVLAMAEALKSARSEIVDLREGRAADRARMLEMEKEISDLREQIRVVEQHLIEAREKGKRLAAQVASYMKEQDRRK